MLRFYRSRGLVAGFVFALLTLALVGCGLPDEIRAKRTQVRIQTITSILLAEKPELVDESYLEAALLRHNRSECVLDGWGNRIQVEVLVTEESGRRYRVVSFGKDGVAGSCCIKWSGKDWDRDAVAVDGTWMQVWN